MALRSILSKVKSLHDISYINNATTLCRFLSRVPYSNFTSFSIHLSLQKTNGALSFNNSMNGNHSCHLHSSASCSAGHSKWSNIKHIKAAQDRKKGENSQALAMKIRLALAKNPQTDPKLNTELASLIKWARSNNVTNDTIERTIDSVVKLRDPSSLTIFEGRGLQNAGVILECSTTKPQHTKDMLQGIIKKYGFNLNSPAADLFEHQGIVEAEVPEAELAAAQNDPDSFPLDKFIDIAIEVGAEDVTLQFDGDNPYLEYKCGPKDCDRIHSKLEEAGLAVTSSERCYVPTVFVPADEDYLQKLDVLKSKLDIHPNVNKYHFNIVPES